MERQDTSLRGLWSPWPGYWFAYDTPLDAHDALGFLRESMAPGRPLDPMQVRMFVGKVERDRFCIERDLGTNDLGVIEGHAVQGAEGCRVTVRFRLRRLVAIGLALLLAFFAAMAVAAVRRWVELDPAQRPPVLLYGPAGFIAFFLLTTKFVLLAQAHRDLRFVRALLGVVD